MTLIHIVPGLGEKWNGIAVAARLMAQKQRGEGHAVELVDAKGEYPELAEIDEVWVHSNWTPQVWRGCRFAIRRGAKLVRVPHANLDPVRYRYHGWKKRLVRPIERYFYAKTARVVVSGAWEAAWCRAWGVRGPFETFDLKPFFDLGTRGERGPVHRPLRVLYVGRRHPLKGVAYLECATEGDGVELRVVSNHFGAELERDWAWCDVLCLPTLSENFGLVVAEALARGKRVLTTDGAPAWEGVEGVTYLKGFREGTEEKRVEMLRQALRIAFVGDI